MPSRQIVSLTGFYEILLEDFERVEIELLHGETEKRDERTLQFLPAETSHDRKRSGWYRQ